MSYLVRNEYRAKRKGNFECDKIASNGVERGECFHHNAAAGEKFSTVNVLRAFCEANNLEIDWASEYGEPGYTHTEKGVLLSDWNRIPKKMQDRLEAQGYALEWSDNWTVDYEGTQKAYRTSPDSHGWEPRIRVCDGYYLFPDSDAQEWIDDSLNDDRRPLPSWFDDSELESRGFALIDQDDKQVGFHPGQDETPEKFTPALTAAGFDYVLQVTDRGQFDVRYRVWTRKQDWETDES